MRAEISAGRGKERHVRYIFVCPKVIGAGAPRERQLSGCRECGGAVGWLLGAPRGIQLNLAMLQA
jgi:hypothetical protein